MTETRLVLYTARGDNDYKSFMNNQKYEENRNLTEYETWLRFNRVRNSIYRLRELELAQFGLTVEQSAILNILTRLGGSATAKTIEDLTMRQHNSISTLINRMIKMNLVAKKKNLDDKKFEILITKHGQELHKKAPVYCLEMLFPSLKIKDQEQLRKYLNTLLVKARDLGGISFIPPFLLKPIESRENGINKSQEYRKDQKLTEIELWMLINRTRNSIYRLRELELAQFGLTVEQSAILYLLITRGGSTTAKTIEHLTMRQHHSISTLINRMIKMNLVVKKKSPDKRFEILITKHGEDLLKKIPVYSLEMVFSSLKAKDREQLLSYLNILLERARDLLGLTFIPPFLVKQSLENSVA